MSIMQKYEQIRREMGEQKYDSIEKYIDTHPDVLLSDILYKPEHYINFDKWYNWKILNRKVRVNGIYQTDFDDVRCDAVLYQNDKAVASIIASYNADEMNFRCNNDPSLVKEVLRTSILDDFDSYLNLPKISKCSKLIQDIYDDVKGSDSTMYHITEEDWQEFYADRYTNKDINKLKEEVKKYKLDDVITFNDGEYKIIGWGNLETSFSDDRQFLKDKERER